MSHLIYDIFTNVPVKRSKQHLAALWEHTVLLAGMALVRTRTQTLAVICTENLSALSGEQHMTVCPDGITAGIVLPLQKGLRLKGKSVVTI